MPGEWIKLRRLRIPQKIKNFVWRAAREVLPNTYTLRRRDVPLSCGYCASVNEDSWHVLLECSYAQNCWQQAGLAATVNNVVAGEISFVDWLFKVIRTVADQVVSKVMVVLWRILKERNERIWNSVSRLPEIVVHL